MDYKTFYIHEANLDLPQLTQDQTLNVFAIPGEHGGQRAILTINRVEAGGKTLDHHVEAFLAERAARLANVEHLGRQTREVGGEPGVELRFRSTGTARPIDHFLLVVMWEGRVLALTFSCETTATESLEPVWHHTVGSVLFRASGT